MLRIDCLNVYSEKREYRSQLRHSSVFINMMETLQTRLSKLFYPLNERLGVTMDVSVSTGRKNRKKYVVFTVSITKPAVIRLYVVKISDKEIKKTLICDARNLKKFDCKDMKSHPTYDMQLTTPQKSWSFVAQKLEEKRNFVSVICSVIASLEPSIFKEIEWANLPCNLNITTVSLNESLDVLLRIADAETDASKSYSKSDPTGNTNFENQEPITDAYRSLTIKEEEDIKLFLDELENGKISQNVTELTERLQTQLAQDEGTNIHSIMESEAQVHRLMSALDNALNQAQCLEDIMNVNHSFLEEVEEAIFTLRDHDILVQATVDNQARLLNTLQELTVHLDLDANYLRALKDPDLKDPASRTLCIKAAQRLSEIVNADLPPGVEHLAAVAERISELRSLRDAFAIKLTRHVNDTILMFASQLTMVASLGSAGNQSDTNANSSGLHANQRNNMLHLAPFVGDWLQLNGKELLVEIRRMYVQKLQFVFKRQTQDVLKATQQSITCTVHPGKSGHKVVENIAVTNDSLISLCNPGVNILAHIKTIFTDCLNNLLVIIQSEQDFLQEFFKFGKPSDRPAHSVNANPLIQDQMSTLYDCMSKLFEDLELDTSNLVGHCEHYMLALVLPLFTATTELADQFSKRCMNTTTNNTATNNKRKPGESTDSEARRTQEVVKQEVNFVTHFLAKLTLVVKKAFDRYIQRLITMFQQCKPSKKARCGTLSIVSAYIEFAECSQVTFGKTSLFSVLEEAHLKLVCALMNNIERIASESVKTPAEVVQFENYHRLQDILRRLKIPRLDEHRLEAKNRYKSALNEFTENCMGRPLEKLASFLENVQAAVDAGVRHEVVSYQFAFSKQELRKVIRKYPGNEVKRGLENLCKKVEKHLSDDGNLFPVVWHSFQSEFISQYHRFNTLIEMCYPDSQISLEFTCDDLLRYFNEIAQSR